jgi:RNA polymerase sigma factor (sigma-70 family)
MQPLDKEQPIRVLIANDNALFRKGLRAILDREESIEVVGEANDGVQILYLGKELRPDIVLIDARMTGINGEKVISSLENSCPGTKALICGSSIDENKIFDLLKAGARGYVSNDTKSQDLLKAFQSIQRGELWLERRLIARYFKNNETGKAVVKRQVEKKADELTPREKEVLSLLSKGMKNKEIAETLSINEKTVKTHLNNIYKKLKVARRLQAVLFAIKKGLG